MRKNSDKIYSTLFAVSDPHSWKGQYNYIVYCGIIEGSANLSIRNAVYQVWFENISWNMKTIAGPHEVYNAQLIYPIKATPRIATNCKVVFSSQTNKSLEVTLEDYWNMLNIQYNIALDSYKPYMIIAYINKNKVLIT